MKRSLESVERRANIHQRAPLKSTSEQQPLSSKNKIPSHVHSTFSGVITRLFSTVSRSQLAGGQSKADASRTTNNNMRASHTPGKHTLPRSELGKYRFQKIGIDETTFQPLDATINRWISLYHPPNTYESAHYRQSQLYSSPNTSVEVSSTDEQHHDASPPMTHRVVKFEDAHLIAQSHPVFFESMGGLGKLKSVNVDGYQLHLQQFSPTEIQHYKRDIDNLYIIRENMKYGDITSASLLLGAMISSINPDQLKKFIPGYTTNIYEQLSLTPDSSLSCVMRPLLDRLSRPFRDVHQALVQESPALGRTLQPFTNERFHIILKHGIEPFMNALHNSHVTTPIPLLSPTSIGLWRLFSSFIDSTRNQQMALYFSALTSSIRLPSDDIDDVVKQLPPAILPSYIHGLFIITHHLTSRDRSYIFPKTPDTPSSSSSSSSVSPSLPLAHQSLSGDALSKQHTPPSLQLIPTLSHIAVLDILHPKYRNSIQHNLPEFTLSTAYNNLLPLFPLQQTVLRTSLQEGDYYQGGDAQPSDASIISVSERNKTLKLARDPKTGTPLPQQCIRTASSFYSERHFYKMFLPATGLKQSSAQPSKPKGAILLVQPVSSQDDSSTSQHPAQHQQNSDPKRTVSSHKSDTDRDDPSQDAFLSKYLQFAQSQIDEFNALESAHSAPASASTTSTAGGSKASSASQGDAPQKTAPITTTSQQKLIDSHSLRVLDVTPQHMTTMTQQIYANYVASLNALITYRHDIIHHTISSIFTSIHKKQLLELAKKASIPLGDIESIANELLTSQQYVPDFNSLDFPTLLDEQDTELKKISLLGFASHPGDSDDGDQTPSKQPVVELTLPSEKTLLQLARQSQPDAFNNTQLFHSTQLFTSLSPFFPIDDVAKLTLSPTIHTLSTSLHVSHPISVVVPLYITQPSITKVFATVNCNIPLMSPAGHQHTNHASHSVDDISSQVVMRVNSHSSNQNISNHPDGITTLTSTLITSERTNTYEETSKMYPTQLALLNRVDLLLKRYTPQIAKSASSHLVLDYNTNIQGANDSIKDTPADISARPTNIHNPSTLPASSPYYLSTLLKRMGDKDYSRHRKQSGYNFRAMVSLFSSLLAASSPGKAEIDPMSSAYKRLFMQFIYRVMPMMEIYQHIPAIYLESITNRSIHLFNQAFISLTGTHASVLRQFKLNHHQVISSSPDELTTIDSILFTRLHDLRHTTDVKMCADDNATTYAKQQKDIFLSVLSLSAEDDELSSTQHSILERLFLNQHHLFGLMDKEYKTMSTHNLLFLHQNQDIASFASMMVNPLTPSRMSSSFISLIQPMTYNRPPNHVQAYRSLVTSSLSRLVTADIGRYMKIYSPDTSGSIDIPFHLYKSSPLFGSDLQLAASFSRFLKHGASEEPSADKLDALNRDLERNSNALIRILSETPMVLLDHVSLLDKIAMCARNLQAIPVLLQTLDQWDAHNLPRSPSMLQYTIRYLTMNMELLHSIRLYSVKRALLNIESILPSMDERCIAIGQLAVYNQMELISQSDGSLKLVLPSFSSLMDTQNGTFSKVLQHDHATIAHGMNTFLSDERTLVTHLNLKQLYSETSHILQAFPVVSTQYQRKAFAEGYIKAITTISQSIATQSAHNKTQSTTIIDEIEQLLDQPRSEIAIFNSHPLKYIFTSDTFGASNDSSHKDQENNRHQHVPGQLSDIPLFRHAEHLVHSYYPSAVSTGDTTVILDVHTPHAQRLSQVNREILLSKQLVDEKQEAIQRLIKKVSTTQPALFDEIDKNDGVNDVIEHLHKMYQKQLEQYQQQELELDTTSSSSSSSSSESTVSDADQDGSIMESKILQLLKNGPDSTPHSTTGDTSTKSHSTTSSILQTKHLLSLLDAKTPEEQELYFATQEYATSLIQHSRLLGERSSVIAAIKHYPSHHLVVSSLKGMIQSTADVLYCLTDSLYITLAEPLARASTSTERERILESFVSQIDSTYAWVYGPGADWFRSTVTVIEQLYGKGPGPLPLDRDTFMSDMKSHLMTMNLPVYIQDKLEDAITHVSAQTGTTDIDLQSQLIAAFEANISQYSTRADNNSTEALNARASASIVDKSQQIPSLSIEPVAAHFPSQLPTSQHLTVHIPMSTSVNDTKKGQIVQTSTTNSEYNLKGFSQTMLTTLIPSSLPPEEDQQNDQNDSLPKFSDTFNLPIRDYQRILSASNNDSQTQDNQKDSSNTTRQPSLMDSLYLNAKQSLSEGSSPRQLSATQDRAYRQSDFHQRLMKYNQKLTYDRPIFTPVNQLRLPNRSPFDHLQLHPDSSHLCAVTQSIKSTDDHTNNTGGQIAGTANQTASKSISTKPSLQADRVELSCSTTRRSKDSQVNVNVNGTVDINDAVIDNMYDDLVQRALFKPISSSSSSSAGEGATNLTTNSEHYPPRSHRYIRQPSFLSFIGTSSLPLACMTHLPLSKHITPDLHNRATSYAALLASFPDQQHTGSDQNGGAQSKVNGTGVSEPLHKQKQTATASTPGKPRQDHGVNSSPIDNIVTRFTAHTSSSLSPEMIIPQGKLLTQDVMKKLLTYSTHSLYEISTSSECAANLFRLSITFTGNIPLQLQTIFQQLRPFGNHHDQHLLKQAGNVSKKPFTSTSRNALPIVNLLGRDAESIQRSLLSIASNIGTESHRLVDEYYHNKQSARHIKHGLEQLVDLTLSQTFILQMATPVRFPSNITDIPPQSQQNAMQTQTNNRLHSLKKNPTQEQMDLDYLHAYSEQLTQSIDDAFQVYDKIMALSQLHSSSQQHQVDQAKYNLDLALTTHILHAVDFLQQLNRHIETSASTATMVKRFNIVSNLDKLFNNHTPQTNMNLISFEVLLQPWHLPTTSLFCLHTIFQRLCLMQTQHHMNRIPGMGLFNMKDQHNVNIMMTIKQSASAAFKYAQKSPQSHHKQHSLDNKIPSNDMIPSNGNFSRSSSYKH